MGEDDVRQPPGRPHRADRPALDLVTTKLLHPLLRPGIVRRSSLIERLAGDPFPPIISVVAPAGYGKTTVLAQWAESHSQSFAWVSVDQRDNDPKVFLTYVAAALDAVAPISERVFDALASPMSSVLGSVVPRLGSAFASMTSPVVLILDDVHVLHNRECLAALPVLADHVPGGSRLVVAGRTRPPLRIARLRAEGRILEIGPGDLSLTHQEASSLLRGAGVTLGMDEVAELHRRTEGWPAGLYLAALYLRNGGPVDKAAVSFRGHDQLVSEYMESEFLSRIARRQRVFLTRTAVLERMCGPLCDVLLGLQGSAVTLAKLARSNLLLVPLDRRKEWYRYHHLFRDMLLAELERREPGLIPVLRRRAASWCFENDLTEEGTEYAIAAGDVDTVAHQVGRHWLRAYRQGRITTLRQWLRWLEERDGMSGHPMLAILASLIAAFTAQPAEAERWADVVDRWQSGGAAPGDSSAQAWAAVLRVVLCRRGVEWMRADADEAARRLAEMGVVGPTAGLVQGAARMLSGYPDEGNAFFADAVSAGQETGAPEALAVALCERSLLAMARNEWDQADALAERARTVLRQAGIEESFATPLVCAVQARTALHRRDIPAVRRELVGAQRQRHMLTYAFPHLAVQARIELIRVQLALADLAGARTLMREVDQLLRRRPDLGTLVAEADELRTQLARKRGSAVLEASALTDAELRLLPMLTTHLSMPEIAQEMSLSLNTVKSAVHSIYRKLGVSSRSEAVSRSRDLGLLDQ